MSPRTQVIHSQFSRSIMTLGLAALAATACRPALRAAPEPAASTLIVRNSSQFDVNVYALPSSDGVLVWLATVPAAGTRSLPVKAAALQSDRTLVIRTRSIGSSGSWTSAPLYVDHNISAVLDLVADGVGNCASSQLYAVGPDGVAIVP
jgi:hypothetical protein